MSKTFRLLLITATLGFMLLTTAANAGRYVDYTRNTSPTTTDTALGVTDPDSDPGWSTRLYTWGDVFNLFLAQDFTFTENVVFTPQATLPTGGDIVDGKTFMYTGLTGFQSNNALVFYNGTTLASTLSFETLPTTTGEYMSFNATTGEWDVTASPGDVVGPASAVDSNLAGYDTTTGKLIKDSGIAAANVTTLDGTQTITGDKTITGATTLGKLTNILYSNVAEDYTASSEPFAFTANRTMEYGDYDAQTVRADQVNADGTLVSSGASITEVADTPEGWEMTPNQFYQAVDDGELSILLADSSEVFRYAATANTALYPLTMAIVGEGTATINGTGYTSSGSPHTITALEGTVDITGLYGGSNDLLTWTGDTVLGSYPDYTIAMGSASKSIIGTFSTSGCVYTFGSELYIVENAVIPSASDFNTTTDWVNSGVSDLSSSAIDPDLGTYHISGTSDSSSDDFYTDYGSALVEGATYRLNIRQRHSGTGGDWIVGLGSTSTPSRLTQDILSTQTTYNDYNAYFIYNEDILGTIVYRENNVSNDGTIYVDNFSITEITNICTGADLNTDSNATAIASEADATTGFTNFGCDVFDSVSTDTPAVGTYHIEAAANVTPTSVARIYKDLELDFGLMEGTRYFITLYAKHVGTGGNWSIGLGANNQTATDLTMFTLDSTETTYKEVGLSFTYEAKYRYLVAKENSASNDGGVFIDGFSIKELEDE